MTQFASVKIEMELHVGEFVFDVARYDSLFALNTIPTARVVVGTGRNVQTGRAAEIHRAYAQLGRDRSAAVYMTVHAGESLNLPPALPAGRRLIFEGKLSGRGWQRGANSAQVVLRLQHWLGDLNKGSAVSAITHPASPANLTYPAIYNAVLQRNPRSPVAGQVAATQTGSPSWVPMVSPAAVTQASLSDLWGNILHPILLELAQEDPLDLEQAVRNRPADLLATLARIGPNPAGVPLNIDLVGADGFTVSEGIRWSLIEDLGTPWTNTTLWGKLVGEWAAAYWFAVVPRVSDALIVPFTGCLRAAPWRTLSVDDNSLAHADGELTQPLRAVGIAWPAASATGILLNAGPVHLNFGGYAGYYQPEDVTEGMVLLKLPPRWLANANPVYVHTLGAEGLAGDALATALDEEGVGGPAQPQRDPVQAQEQQQGLMDALARHWYAVEALKTRVAEVAGRLRFDIAPGSNVRVDIGGSRNLATAQDDLADEIYGTVVQVACVIDAQERQAGTSFTLAHVQTRDENQSDAFSVEKPPLYAQPWRGAPLIPDGG